MTWTVDARIPVRLGALTDAADGDALLLEGDGAAPSGLPAAHFSLSVAAHPPGCACCAERSPAAMALDRLFQARAKGEIPFFRRVLAVTGSVEAETALWAALRCDQLASARFRME